MFLKRILGLFVADDLRRDGFLVRLCVRPLHRSHREPFPILAFSFNMGVNGERVLGAPRRTVGKPSPTIFPNFSPKHPCRKQPCPQCTEKWHRQLVRLARGDWRNAKNDVFGVFYPLLTPTDPFFPDFFYFVALFAPRPFQRYTTRPAAGRISRG